MKEAFERYMKAQHTGRDNAIKSRTLESIFNCKGGDIRRVVNELRIGGVPICSCGNGYFYSEYPPDKQETLDHLAARISSMQAAHDGMERGGRI